MGIGEIVFRCDFWRNIAFVDTHVSILSHGGLEEEIFDIGSGIAGTTGSVRDGAVEM
jgi:prepilin-type processing-associated H-X9-DG protein